VDPSRNRTATPEEVRQALTEADALLAAIEPLDLLPAADLIRAKQPSGEAIAILARRAIRLVEHARQRRAGGQPKDRDELTRALREILRAKPAADVDQVIEALRTRHEFDVADDGTVDWGVGEASRQNIAKRIARLRPSVRRAQVTHK
jgi:hypothetical protein